MYVCTCQTAQIPHRNPSKDDGKEYSRMLRKGVGRTGESKDLKYFHLFLEKDK